MILHLPNELICLITGLCTLKGQASVSRCCRRLYIITNSTLYQNDVNNYESSSVFYAIVWCTQQNISLGTLEAARNGGASFELCRDRKSMHLASLGMTNCYLYSPIHLAARRGLDDVVSFLVNSGISPDGPSVKDGKPNVVTSPLAEAIHHQKESTAILLVRSGASIIHRPTGFNAVSDTVRYGLLNLLKLFIDMFRIDINADLGYGCNMVTLAINHSQKAVVRQLVHMGADLQSPLRQLSRSFQFTALSWVFEMGPDSITGAIRTEGVIDLIASISVQRPSPVQKNEQIEILDKLLNVLGRKRPIFFADVSITDYELDYILSTFLEWALSIKVADSELANLFLRHGAKLQAGVLFRILYVLNSDTFAKDSIRSVRLYPKLLQSLDFVYSYCLNIPPSEVTFMTAYFMKNVPSKAIRLVSSLKDQNMPLTVEGVQKLSCKPCYDT